MGEVLMKYKNQLATDITVEVITAPLGAKPQAEARNAATDR